MTYPLGWSVVPQLIIRRERWPGGYRTKGTPLVHPGQEVQPNQPIMRLEAHQAPESFAPSEKQRMSNGFTPANNQQRYETVPAGLRGRVVDITRRGGVVIESHAAVVQGALGAGNQVAGILTTWQTRGQQQIPPGAILVIPGPLSFAMLRQAISSGVVGLVASSIAVRDLEGFLQTDLLELINSVDIGMAQAQLPALTVLLTEGLGTLAMPARVLNLLNQYQGSIVLLSGATSVRQGILPELIISLPAEEVQRNWHPVRPDPTVAIGSQVRVCGGTHLGAVGEVSHLFSHQQIFGSGIRSHAARLRLEDGSMLVVPLTLLERIG
jgi:hypothetical protein